MNKKSLDRILNYFREEGMVANAPGTQGGFSHGSDAAGPTAGLDKPLGRKKRYIYQRNTRKNWTKKSES